MDDIDALLLRAEFNITAILIGQLVLGVLAALFAVLGRRRWARVWLVLTFALAVVACGGTLYQCELARASAEGRLAGQIPGPHLTPEKAEKHLTWVTRWSRVSIGLAVATTVGSGVLYHFMRGRANGLTSTPGVTT